MITVDDLWDALRRVACATRPHTDATCIVLLRRDDVAKALQMIGK